MPATSCEWVLQKLTRLDEVVDGPGVEPVVTGLVRFLDGVLHPVHASVLLCDPETAACESWQVAKLGGGRGAARLSHAGASSRPFPPISAHCTAGTSPKAVRCLGRTAADCPRECGPS